MAMHPFQRTARLLGSEAMEKLASSRVALFGAGGVGGSAAEALVRSGIGAIDLFDDDRVALTNLNRQVIALHSTIGRYKVDVLAERLLDINPSLSVGAHRLFYMPDTAEGVDLSRYQYIVDAIDTVTAKLELITRAHALGVPIICALGAGNKLDPTRLRVADITETSVCPLARVIRREVRKRGIEHLKVVYSTEPAINPAQDAPELDEPHAARRSIPGSTAFVPPAMGLIIASQVVCDLTGVHQSVH